MQLIGFLFLFIIATSVVSKALGAKFEDDPDEIDKTLRNIAKDKGKYLISITFDLVSHITIIILACALYYVFSPINGSLALLGTILRIVEGVILAVVEINNLVLFTVSQDYIAAEGAEVGALETTSRTIILREKRGFTIGLAFFALGALAYSTLFISSKAVPLALAWLGVIASVLAFTGIWLRYFRPKLPYIYQIGFLLMILFEIILGFWLLFS